MCGLILLFMEYFSLSPIPYLATVLGIQVGAVKLIASIMMSYVLAANIDIKNPTTKKLCFIFTGLDIGIFNFGFDVLHTLVAVLFVYGILKIFGPSKISTIINFVFTMTYLLVGYYYTESDEYDITWTMPFCVLVLRLIAVSFDMWDGSKPDNELSQSFKKTALREELSLIDFMSYMYFPASFLVGPQFSKTRYNKFMDGDFDIKDATPTKADAAFTRFLTGVLYLCVYQVLAIYFPDDYFFTQEFKNSSFLYKHYYLGFWGKCTLTKYIACWLLSEAACIRFGISYNGSDNGVTLWNGCSNVKLLIFEGATRFGHYIDSFNVNTNLWSANYIYKRCIWLGNRFVSQAITIFFLALWHGLHSGYYATFAMEFIIMFMEKRMQPFLEKFKFYNRMWSNQLVTYILYVVLKIYTFVFMGFCMVPFHMKTFSRWWEIYSSVYFFTFFFFVFLIIGQIIIERTIKKRRTA